MSVGADGTVTMIDGDRIYAFGHRFLAGGPTEMPFARAEVLALLPNLSGVLQDFDGARMDGHRSPRIATPRFRV